MPTLHTVNKSPFETRTLQSCLNHASEGDSILLIEDGIYGAVNNSEIADIVAANIGKISILVLTPDLVARGLNEDRLIKGIGTIDYAGFVDMAAKHDLNQAWL